MKILFVCTGNTCRSPMAQYLFEEEMKKRGVLCECRSAGLATFTGNPASDLAVAVMKEINIDISGFRSTSIRSILAEEFDLYVPMTYNHAHALLELGIGKKKIYLFDKDVIDPYGGNIEFYRKTRDDLIQKLRRLAAFVEQNYGGNEV